MSDTGAEAALSIRLSLMADSVDGRFSELSQLARGVMARAYAPYSEFQVGAALLCENGEVVVGCNVENASYPAGTCAERVALGAAVAAGHRRFLGVVIATQAGSPTPPCGICRQALAEFGTDIVVIAVGPNDVSARWLLSDLLPHPFTPSSLD